MNTTIKGYLTAQRTNARRSKNGGVLLRFNGLTIHISTPNANKLINQLTKITP